jgi:hypothetical protein
MSHRERPARPVTTVAAIFAVVLAAPALASAAESAEARGLAVAQKADKANQGFVGERAKLTLELINAHGDVTSRKMVLEIAEGTDDGDRSRSTFEWPADVKGTRLLTWTHKKGDDDRWLYLPAVKRIKRIASSSKSGSFMGSEFSYEDLSSQEVEKYTYKLLDEVKVDVKDGARDTWRVERRPVDKDSGYTRQIVWMDKEFMNPVKIEYHDRKNELLKVAYFEGYKKVGAFWRFGSIRVENVQTKKRSKMTWEDRQLGLKLPAEMFDSARLEN